ncbi:hypothetical protein RI129_008323 [Pyrocoelia pectoralis]|uniref:Uncharacterized protein n=1 Tax=Pyrocoelia pectoralis TaxID=417401 RepID=A0AAN7ZK93_9COLE
MAVFMNCFFCMLFILIQAIIISICTPLTPTPYSVEKSATTESLASPCNSRSSKKDLILMSRELDGIPKGSEEVETLDVSYNNIQHLPGYIFWNNSYINVKKLSLQQNRISNVSVDAFKGARYVHEIDISDNLITSIDPYTFNLNTHLQKLIIMNNRIRFNRLQTFILSSSIQYLVLSNNQIDQIYEVTFLGVPNLRSLVLNDNEVHQIAPNSFRALNKLHYLSLANTGVYRLGQSTFKHVPSIVNLEGTPLSLRFEPPLKKVTGQSVSQLIDLLNAMLDSDEDLSKL